ncbi:MAG: SDR family NAD(P)-dependent oxidoreductase [Steroidobacteraceae bacterium]
MIAMVTRAERSLADAAGARARRASGTPPRADPAAQFMPVLRGALAEDRGAGSWRRIVLERRVSPQILDYLQRPEVERYTQAGPVTPDHVLRIKPWPLLLPAGIADGPIESMRTALRDAVAAYRNRYQQYFARHNARVGGDRRALDASPRVVLVPELGLIGIGSTKADAAIAADVAETNVAVIAASEALGPYTSIDEADVFDVEYWSLEQAKLGNTSARRLAGQIVVVTGGGGTIGAAIARAVRTEGAEIVVLDRNRDAALECARTVKGLGLECDVTDQNAVRRALEIVCGTFGGLDILVSNAGAAWTGAIGSVEDADLRSSFELNFFAHQNVAREAVTILQRQGSGGVLLFNASKQALNPGPNFGPYGIPKAAVVALAKQYAIDYAAAGIRANVVNADRIRSGLLTDAMIAQRSSARGVSEHDYMRGNLLGLEVRASDVADAFVALALAQRTTAAIVTVDGGNIAASVR